MWVWDSRRKWSTFCSWLFRSVCLSVASLSHRQTVGKIKGPRFIAIKLPFFSFCDCNKKHFAKGHPEFCVLFISWLSLLLLFLLSLSMFFYFLSADDYLNAKKYIWLKWKKERKLEYLVSRLELPLRLDVKKRISVLLPPHTLCSLLHSHTTVVGGLQDGPPLYLLSAHCLRSCWEKRSLDLIPGDSFSWKKKPV